MRETFGWPRFVAVLAACALVGSGCTRDDPGAAPIDAEPGLEDGPDPGEPDVDIRTDVGVTEEQCPEAVDPDHGCIYLGVLSDLTEGPFAALAVPITEGQRAFWKRVNDDGGIGGYEIDIDTYTRDTLYDPDEHRDQYRQIEPNILALAQTLGTATTRAIVDDMDDDDVLGAPASWWSGWSFEEQDSGVILESGYSYCLESMIALDWLSAEREQPNSVIAVGYGDGYGADVAAGAEHWAAVNDADFLGLVETAPNAEIGSQDVAVDEIVDADADVVLLALSPTETGEIVSDAADRGYIGQFIGSIPTWNPVLLETPAAGALQALYLHVSPWTSYEAGETAAHEAMRESLTGRAPTNDGFTFGWVLSYPLKAALEAAVEQGDLTREGLRDAADGAPVDFEAALPPRRLGGEPDTDIVRTAAIAVPSEDAPLGLALLEAGVTGPTADAYEYTSACSGT